MFEISDEQRKKIRAWSTEIDERIAKEQGREDGPYYGAIGGSLTYMFTPTSIGVIIQVKHASGEELDVSDYDSW